MIPDFPPPSVQAGADSLQALILDASVESLGLFFAEIGLEAAPDEVVRWETGDFIEIIQVYGDCRFPGKAPDSVKVFMGGLPLHLLEPDHQ